MLVGCREGFSKRKNTVRACGAGTEVLGAKKDAEFGDEAEADTRPSGETASEKKGPDQVPGGSEMRFREPTRDLKFMQSPCFYTHAHTRALFR